MRSQLYRFVKEFSRHRVAVGALGVLLVLALTCALASVLAPYPPDAEYYLHVSQGPTHAFLLGTDDLGRDNLSRLMFGGQATFVGMGEALGVFLLLGVSLGLVAGFLRGAVDT